MDWESDPAYVRRRRQDRKTVTNDDLTDERLIDLLRRAFTIALEHCRPGAAWYVAAPGGPRHVDFALVLAELGLVRETLMWVKDQFVFGRQDYHWRHEPIFYGWKPGGRHYWAGGRDQDTVWEIPRPRRSAEHPTMKPVALIERSLQNSSCRDAVVLDPFAGSGSTLIAAETTGRRCLAMEIDPHYCDVIRRRYEDFTRG
jgi:site-specific DNA-methyltransferase (adenine-specific)